MQEFDLTCDHDSRNELVTYNTKIIYYYRSLKEYEKILQENIGHNT